MPKFYCDHCRVELGRGQCQLCWDEAENPKVLEGRRPKTQKSLVQPSPLKTTSVDARRPSKKAKMSASIAPPVSVELSVSHLPTTDQVLSAVPDSAPGPAVTQVLSVVPDSAPGPAVTHEDFGTALAPARFILHPDHFQV